MAAFQGLSARPSVADSFAQADAAGVNFMNKQKAQVEQQRQQATQTLMAKYAESGKTLEDLENLGNNMMGPNPKLGMDIAREARARKKEVHTRRKDAFAFMMERVEGVDSADSYEEAQRLTRQQYGDVEGLDNVWPTYDEFEGIKGAWTGELKAMIGLAGKVQQAEEAKDRWGDDDPRTVAAMFEAEKAEKAFVDASKKADDDAAARAKKLANPDIAYKQRTRRLADGKTKQDEFSEDGGKTWQLLGEPYSASEKASVTPTGFTNAQAAVVKRTIEANPVFGGLDNLDLMVDDIVSRANKRAKNSEDDYTTIIRQILKEIEATSLKPFEERSKFGFDWLAPDAGAEYTPKNFLTKERAKTMGIKVQTNTATGEMRAKVGSKWLPVI